MGDRALGRPEVGQRDRLRAVPSGQIEKVVARRRRAVLDREKALAAGDGGAAEIADSRSGRVRCRVQKLDAVRRGVGTDLERRVASSLGRLRLEEEREILGRENRLETRRLAVFRPMGSTRENTGSRRHQEYRFDLKRPKRRHYDGAHA